MRCDPAAGLILGGRYRLERFLAEGGMGVVWSAVQLLSGQSVAVKLPKIACSVSRANRSRLLQEVRAAVKVSHPNVIQIFDVLELDDGAPAIVMELLEGESLEARLEREGKLPSVELCRIMIPVASALSAAHGRGVVHRDLKPANIVLARTGGEEVVKVVDFGIAKVFAGTTGAPEQLDRTATGVRLGTLHYMSPEQAYADGDVDYRSDIWSFGILLYRGLSGVLPTEGARGVGQLLDLAQQGLAPLAEIAPEVPAELSSAVDRMLCPSPDDRLADWRVIKGMLERCADGRLPSSPRPPALSSVRVAIVHKNRARRSLAVCAVASAVPALAAGGFYGYEVMRPNDDGALTSASLSAGTTPRAKPMQLEPDKRAELAVADFTQAPLSTTEGAPKHAPPPRFQPAAERRGKNAQAQDDEPLRRRLLVKR